MTFRPRLTVPLVISAFMLCVSFVAPSVARADTLSWQRTYAGPDNLPNGDSAPLPVAGAFNGVSFADATHGWAIGVRVDNVGIGVPAGMFAFTSDGGSTWTSGTVGTAAELNAVVTRPDGRVWAVGAAGTVARWTGTSWTASTVSGWPSGKQLRAVTFTDETHGWAVGDGLGVVRTTDAGVTWSIVTTPTTTGASLRGVAPIDATHALAVGDGGSMRLLTGASSSAKSSGTGNALYGATFVDINRGWAVGDGPTILRTANGGTTWTPVSPLPLPAGVPESARSTRAARGVAFFDSMNGVVVGRYQTVWRTFDGGDTWACAALKDDGTGDDAELRGVAFVPGASDAPVAVGRGYGLQLASSDDKARAYRGTWADRVVPPPTPPTAPIGVTLADGGTPGQPSIRVSWTDASSNEDGFVVERALGSPAGVYSRVGTVTAGETTLVDTGIDWSSTWYYRVRSFRGTVSSAWTASSAGLKVDGIAPATFADIQTSYLESAHIVLAASDAGSGVATTRYKFDGVSGEGTVIDASGVGRHTLEYWSVDTAGNEEARHLATFTITSPAVPDTIAPVTTSDARRSYVGPATVSLSATDNIGGSGVARTYACIDGASQVETTVVTVTALGHHTLRFWSVDAAGTSEATQTVTFDVLQATKLHITSNHTKVTHRHPVTIYGTISPDMPSGTHVVVYAKKPHSSRWVKLATRSTYSRHHWTYKYAPSTRGTWYFQARFGATSKYAACTSSSRKISVR
jgi:photosystem II stability/assembly factor-like uncharacterized protein